MHCTEVLPSLLLSYSSACLGATNLVFTSTSSVAAFQFGTSDSLIAMVAEGTTPVISVDTNISIF